MAKTQGQIMQHKPQQERGSVLYVYACYAGFHKELCTEKMAESSGSGGGLESKCLHNYYHYSSLMILTVAALPL